MVTPGAEQADTTTQQFVNDTLDRLYEKNNGVSGDPIAAAVENFRTTGTISNSQAEHILNTVKSITAFREQTGIKLNGLTKSQKRQAVKDGIAKPAQTEVDIAPNADYDNGIEQGGAEHGTGEAQAYDERTGEASTFEISRGGQASQTDRSGVSSPVGATGEGYSEIYLPGGQRELNYSQNSFLEEDYYIPEPGSSLEQAQRAFENDYGISSHVVKATSWGKEALAFSVGGKVYICETIDADTLATAVPHESTHVMKQNGFQPYIDFVRSTPSFFDFSNPMALKLLDIAAKHRKVSIADMTDADFIGLYDELNAIVYGMYKSGIITNSQLGYEWIPEAISNFNGYISELDSIHEQYRAQVKGQSQANAAVGAADAHFTGKQAYYDLLSDDNLKPGKKTGKFLTLRY